MKKYSRVGVWVIVLVQYSYWSTYYCTTHTHEKVLNYNYRVGVWVLALVLLLEYTFLYSYSYSWKSTQLQVWPIVTKLSHVIYFLPITRLKINECTFPNNVVPSLQHLRHIRPKKGISGFWSSVGFKISAMTRFFLSAIFFLVSREIRDTLYTRGPNYPLQSMVAKRGLTNLANVKKSFKAQHGRIPIDPAILAAIGHRFIARGDQKPETFFPGHCYFGHIPEKIKPVF